MQATWEIAPVLAGFMTGEIAPVLAGFMITQSGPLTGAPVLGLALTQ